jgi:hypothetical protein
MMEKFPRGFFRIKSLELSALVMGREYLKEIYAAVEDHLSFRLAISDWLQLEYTFGNDLAVHHDCIDVARVGLNRNLTELFPAIRDEILEALTEEIPHTNGLYFLGS